jgi:hypothetical protein
MKWLAVVAVVLATLAPSAAANQQQEQRPWLWQCAQIGRVDAQWTCYVRMLLADIDHAGNPAAELPKIDRRARESGTALESMCHPLMHEVGRRYGAEHRVTLADLMDYIPRSNDPTCSAGFGMGLVMYLGPQIILTGGRSALEECMRLPTRYRSYTCVHGIGHALMRGYHGQLRQTVVACRKLGAQAPDCAQGAFHDYWISLRGADGTTRPRNANASPRTICDGRFTYVRPCWYRYFLEQPAGLPIRNATDLRRTCRGLESIQRFGCISAATLTISGDPFEQMRVCMRMSEFDSGACVRGVADQALAGEPRRQLALIRMCRLNECYMWIGRTLAVVTNGRFDCAGLAARARMACAAGAGQMHAALVTFS